MKLKCIGGEQDGLVMHVDNSYLVHDFVKVPAKIKSALFANNVPETAPVNYLLYHICEIKYGNIPLKLKFLCPKDWNEWEAIVHQFGK